MKTSTFLKISGGALLTASLLSCGGDDNDGGDIFKQGKFVDSAVQGITYVSGDQVGVTNAKGAFSYYDGNNVRFSIGDIFLGTGPGKEVMSPIDLVPGATDVTNPAVINIARFLQTLDDDANLANGIQITGVQSSLAVGKSVNFNQDTTAFENDGNVQTVVATLTSASPTGAKNLIPISDAQFNLQNGLTGGSLPPINPISTPPPSGGTPTPTPPPSGSNPPPAPSPSGFAQLPDTGQTKCYDNNNVIDCPANPSQPFYGQDAQYQGAKPAYQDNKNGTVTDLNTGLTWQQDGRASDIWNDARAACLKLQNPPLGGYSDWRLPRRRELVSIIDYSRVDPIINTQFFLETAPLFYWSSTQLVPDPRRRSPEDYWIVGFGGVNEVVQYSSPAEVHSVRCVRGNLLPEGDHRESPGRFKDNNDDTITDTFTGLVWERQRFTSGATQGSWQEVLARCDTLPLAGGGWRLPNIRELESLVDLVGNIYPAIDPLFPVYGVCSENLPDCPQPLDPMDIISHFWSSTTSEQIPKTAWTVDFGQGFVGALPKTERHPSRCVRGPIRSGAQATPQ